VATQLTEEIPTLLAEEVWTGRIYGDGWSDAPGAIDIIQPATGAVIGSAGVAQLGQRQPFRRCRESRPVH